MRSRHAPPGIRPNGYPWINGLRRTSYPNVRKRRTRGIIVAVPNVDPGRSLDRLVLGAGGPPKVCRDLSLQVYGIISDDLGAGH